MSDFSNLPDVFDLAFEPPYLVVLKVRRDIVESHVHDLFDVLDPLLKDQPFWLFEVEISDLGSAEAPARRAAVERMKRLPPYSMTVYNGSFMQRTIARLFFKAADLLTKGRGNMHEFSVDKQASREWLAAEVKRRQLAVNAS